MGLILAYDDGKTARDSKKGDLKAVLKELSKEPLNKATYEKKISESVLLKAKVVSLKEIMTDAAQAVFQLYTNLLIEEPHQPMNFSIKKQMELFPYIDIFGVEQKKSLGHPSQYKSAYYSTSCCVLHMTLGKYEIL